MLDLQFPMVLDSQGAIASTSDPARIWRQRVYAVISTYVGQRVMRPTFGTKALDMVFETESSLLFVATQVVNRAFTTSLPGFNVTSVSVGDQFRSDGQFQVEIVFTNPQGVQDTVAVPLSVDTFAVGGTSV
jgi:phage baseplate assembly protein W